MIKFSENLEQQRTSRGLLQRDVAAALDIAVRTYIRYENGQREPQMSTLVALADFFDITLDELVGREQRPRHITKEEA